MIYNACVPQLKIADIFRSNNLLVVCFYCGEPKDILVNKTSSCKKIICPEGFSSLLFFDIKESTKYYISYKNTEYCVSANTYNDHKRKFTLSTMVKNEDDYIIPWIKFHQSIGFEHFVIYDNSQVSDKTSWTSSSDKSDLKLVLKDYVDNGLVTLINWNVPKRINGRLYGQASQQTHSLHAFSKSNYICYIDIDEYINLKKDKNINEFIKSINTDKKINCFCFRSRLFHNSKNKSEDPSDFLLIDTCDAVLDGARRKSIVKTRSINTFAIHSPTSASTRYIIPKGLAYINHYFFLNKNYRGRDSAKYVDKSILRHIINNENINSCTGL